MEHPTNGPVTAEKESTMKRLIAKLRNRGYRTAYLAEHVRTGIAFQIRALREKTGWTQTQLGTAAGKPQNVISRLEDPDYGRVTLQTLLQLADTFDVALIVRFVPYSRFLTEFQDVSELELLATPFDEDVIDGEYDIQYRTAAGASGNTIDPPPVFQLTNETTVIATGLAVNDRLAGLTKSPNWSESQGTHGALEYVV